MAVMKPGVIALFDVDGTLTAPRKDATLEMLGFMRELRKVVTVGIVGGSDLSKITEQLGRIVSKAALNAYTRILAKKYPSFCINCVCPGYVKTDINCNSGILTIEEGA